MKSELTARLRPTDPAHEHMVDAFAYMIAAQEAKVHNDYILLHVRVRPWWIPKFVYDWLLKRILVLNSFKR